METEIERLRKKLENYPSPSAYNRLADMLRMDGDNDEAEAICRRCISEFPRNGQAYVTLASIYLRSDQRDQAIEMLEKAVAQDRRCYGGYRMLADQYVELGRSDRALDLLQHVLTFKPNDTSVQKQVADLERMVPEQAVATATEAPPDESPLQVDAAEPREDSGVIDLSALSPSMTTAPVQPASRAKSSGRHMSPLALLCEEDGVRGALIADQHGRLLMAQNVESPADEVLGALSVNFNRSGHEALVLLGNRGILTWTVSLERRQICAFRRLGELTLVVVAEPQAKTALIELRARQALKELEGR